MLLFEAGLKGKQDDVNNVTVFLKKAAMILQEGKLFCGAEECWCNMLLELCIPAALHAAFHT